MIASGMPLMRSPCYVKYFYLLVEKPKLTALKTTSAQHREHGTQGRILTFERPIRLLGELEALLSDPGTRVKDQGFNLIMPKSMLHMENLFIQGSEHLVCFYTRYNPGEVVIVVLISIIQMNKLRLHEIK